MAEIVINANDRRIQYTATAAQTVFPYDFPVYENTELTVLRNRAGTITTRALTVDYTVSGVGAESGGNVTLTAGATLNDQYTIYGTTPYERTTDYGTGGDFKAATVNKDFDRLVIMAQQLDTRVGRCLSLNLADGSTPLTFAVASTASRQSKILSTDATGLLVEATLSLTDFTSGVSDAIAAAAAAAASAAAAATSESNSATSESNAASSESAAAASASSASTSATNSANSATSSSNSATSSANSATAAGNSATAAAASAVSAAASATTATTQAGNAATSAAAASTSAGNAATSETNAAASAVSAAASAAKLTGTSTTSLLIATGAKVFTTQASKFFDAGNWLLITSDADPTNFMHGQVTTYSGTTLTMNITNIGGAGTFADWTIRLSGTRGATGAAGTLDFTALAAEATLATDDLVVIYDTSEGANNKMTVANFFKGVSAFTADATPDVTADYLLSYDNSATAAKKVLMNVLLTDANMTFTDITTNNASTTKHGYLKKLSNIATEYMDGTGAWSTPGGGGASNIDGLSDALYDVTTGHNLVLGTNTAFANAGAQFNIFIGEGAGKPGSATATTDNNIGIGYQALNAITSAGNNVAIGTGAMLVATTSPDNVAVGYNAMVGMTTSNGRSVAIGSGAASGSTTAQKYVAIGYQALATQGTNEGNIAIGYQAMSNADSGSGSVTNNVAIGNAALQGSGTPASNTGIQNVVVGAGAAQSNTTGSNNVIIGYNASNAAGSGSGNTTGSNNVFIGCNGGFNGTGPTNAIAIGFGAVAGANNTGVIGNADLIRLDISAVPNSASVKALNTAKWFVKANTAGAIQGTSFNVAGLTDTGTGDISVTIGNDHDSVNYVPFGIAERTASTNTATFARDVSVKSGTQAAGTISFECWDKTATTNVIKDPNNWFLGGFGSQ